MNYNITALMVFIVTFSVRTFALTAGYHRYFATSRVFQFILALIDTWVSQKGPLWWSGHHRYHHIHSDKDTIFINLKTAFSNLMLVGFLKQEVMK